MAIITEMASGRRIAAADRDRGDAAAPCAGRTGLPRPEPRLQEAVAGPRERLRREVDGLLARLYAAPD